MPMCLTVKIDFSLAPQVSLSATLPSGARVIIGPWNLIRDVSEKIQKGLLVRSKTAVQFLTRNFSLRFSWSSSWQKCSNNFENYKKISFNILITRMGAGPH